MKQHSLFCRDVSRCGSHLRDKTLVAKRAAIRSSPELFCWVCPSKACRCWVEAKQWYPLASCCPPQASQPAPGAHSVLTAVRAAGPQTGQILGASQKDKGQEN